MIEFKAFQESHLTPLRQWLAAPHVREYWQEDPGKLREKFLIELPKRGLHAFVISYDGRDIGFIQYYEAARVGGGWWLNEEPGIFGLDLLIGSGDFVGKGLGSEIVREFIGLVAERESSLRGLIIDPDPRNARAIRAFERAGFAREGEIETPGGRALLLRMPLQPVEKVLAYITRGHELLVFEHEHISEAGVQVPAGTVEPGEELRVACLREVEEESGLKLRAPQFLTRKAWIRDDRAQVHLRNVFQIPVRDLPGSWVHAASGSSEEDGLRFRFYWIPVADGERVLAADQGKYLRFIR